MIIRLLFFVLCLTLTCSPQALAGTYEECMSMPWKYSDKEDVKTSCLCAADQMKATNGDPEQSHKVMKCLNPLLNSFMYEACLELPEAQKGFKNRAEKMCSCIGNTTAHDLTFVLAGMIEQKGSGTNYMEAVRTTMMDEMVKNNLMSAAYYCAEKI